VAHEIKRLADQSKDATQQVKRILEDTRKWISAVVMTMEQGNQAVNAGVNQSVAVGESIRQLARSVESSAQSATVIESSSAQQFVGMDQVSAAMSNIELAMQQNITATSQLGGAIERIKGLGEALTKLVRYYKI
jgi:methyl-accepting chemotaxis protein